MSQTTKAISQCGVSRTLTLTTEYQELFDYPITVGTVDISMSETGFGIGSSRIIVGGGIAKNDVSTGGLFFDNTIDNTRFPITYSANSNEKNYTVKFDYDSNNKIVVAKEVNDPEVTIVFTAMYTSCVENYPNNVQRIDRIIENTASEGISIDNVIKLNAGVEMANLPVDTITFNQAHEFITFTNISSKATRVGKICSVVVKASLAVSGALLAAGSIHDFFSVTPTGSYSSAYVYTGSLIDNNTSAVSAIFNDANTADFKLVLPRTLSDGASTTVYASIVYMAS